mmetsp:Transcript_36533/g.60511  ORF Transcript_36533/g.60511 Transcript_36533/m.60511 type:complete len:120 (+) Transcript_36533:109-468(+)
MEKEDDIQQACQLLTVYMYCRRQAAELRSCRERGSLRSIASLGSKCGAEHAAFVTCCNEHSGQVVTALVKIADQRCPEQVAAYQLCKSQSLGSDCEHEDMAAMLCAGRHVLKSAMQQHA